MSDSVFSEIERVNAAADLVMDECQHCTVTVEVLAMNGDLPSAVGVTHEQGCPLHIDWP